MHALMARWLTDPPELKKSGMFSVFVQKAPGHVLYRTKKQEASNSVGAQDGWIPIGPLTIWCIRSWCGSLKSTIPPCTKASVPDCGDCGLLRRDVRLVAFDCAVLVLAPSLDFRTTCWLSSLNMRDSSSLYPGHSRFVLTHCEQAGRSWSHLILRDRQWPQPLLGFPRKTMEMVRAVVEAV